MRPLPPPAIEANGIGKRYRLGERQAYRSLRGAFSGAFRRRRERAAMVSPDLWALRDVSFRIDEGEAVGIIGRNGAGKTTLLKVLSRITEPTEGIAHIAGRIGLLLEVGTGFHPELTGRENVFLNGTILGMRRREVEKSFDEIVAFAEVETFLDTPVKHYSSGMQMRLAFAVAAHLNPEILLVDEVLAVGDAAFQRKCLGKMRDVTSEGRTVLFVSHNLQAIRTICDRAILLERGRVVVDGPSEGSIDRYLSAVGESMRLDVETARLERPAVVAGSTALRISRVRLELPPGQPTLHVGDPIVVTFEFDVADDLQDVVFGWSVHSGDNVRIFECRSVDSYEPVTRLRAGIYSLRSELPHGILNEGLYTLHVGARSAAKSLDYLPDVLAFRVESRESFSSLWLEAPGGGLIRVKAQWSPPAART